MGSLENNITLSIPYFGFYILWWNRFFELNLQFSCKSGFGNRIIPYVS
jgi:hypothetical protein